jgi:hypothetical protein
MGTGRKSLHRTTSVDPNIINVISCNNNDNNCNCVEQKKKEEEEKFPPTINKKVGVFEGNMMMGLVVLSGTEIMKTLRSRN